MAWQLLAAALPAAAKTVGTYLNKPDQDDYKPQTDYMKKYLSYLRGRQANKEVMHMAMQPQLRAVGQQGRQMQQQVGYDVAKTGLTGSGIEAQMRLSAGQKTQQALSTATEKAVAAQTAETARLGEKAADVEARIGAEEQRSEQAFKTAKSQWKKQLAGDIIGLGASVASAGIQQGVANKGAYQQAVTSGTFEGSYDDFKAAASAGTLPGAEGLGLSEAEVGRMSPSQYASALGARKQQISGLRLAERYMTTEEVKRMMDEGMTVDTIISEASNVHQRVTTSLGKIPFEEHEAFLASQSGKSFIAPGANLQSEAASMEDKIAALPEDTDMYIDPNYQEATTLPGGIKVDSPMSHEMSQLMKDADVTENVYTEDAAMVPNVDLYGNPIEGDEMISYEERVKQLGIKPKKVETTKPVKKTETVSPVKTSKTVTPATGKTETKPVKPEPNKKYSLYREKTGTKEEVTVLADDKGRVRIKDGKIVVKDKEGKLQFISVNDWELGEPAFIVT